eukprot:Hpha_TRINITY_DN1808_c0_g2::TRINITY_DN1808_c0_g2_i1::g.170457::m.170457
MSGGRTVYVDRGRGPIQYRPSAQPRVFVEQDESDHAASLGLGISAAPGLCYSSLVAMQRDDVATQAGGAIRDMGDVITRTTTGILMRPEHGGEVKMLGATLGKAKEKAVDLEDAVMDEIDPLTGEHTARALEMRAMRGEDIGEGRTFYVRRKRLNEGMGFNFGADLVLRGVMPGSPAERAGMGDDFVGWRLDRVNGKKVYCPGDCAGHMDTHNLTVCLLPPSAPPLHPSPGIPPFPSPPPLHPP